jgi:hypothetical protein
MAARKPERVPPQALTIAQFGDLFHMATLFFTFIFAYLVVLHFEIFDPSWKEEGFCVKNRDVSHWNSHDMCFYFDTAASLLLVAVYFLYSGSQSPQVNKELITNIPGILGHGIAHGAIGRAIRMDDSMYAGDVWETGYQRIKKGTTSTPELVQGLVALSLFWLFLIKATLPAWSYRGVALLSLVVMAIQAFIPQVFGFTYVQTVLLVLFSVAQLSRPSEEKGFSYALYPAIVGLPLALISFLESTMCSAFVRDWLYGHLVYDAYIPVSIFIWYLLCRKHHLSSVVKDKLA